MTGLRTIALAFAASLAAAGAQAANYLVVDRIAGPDGGWDYVRVDTANNRVLVTRGGSVMSA